jgi:hypothetical protein
MISGLLSDCLPCPIVSTLCVVLFAEQAELMIEVSHAPFARIFLPP